MLQESAGPLEVPRLTYGDLYKKNRIMGSKLASVMKVKANIGHSHQLSPYCFHSNTENTLSKPTHLGGQNSNRTQSGKSAKSMTQHEEVPVYRHPLYLISILHMCSSHCPLRDRSALHVVSKGATSGFKQITN